MRSYSLTFDKYFSEHCKYGNACETLPADLLFIPHIDDVVCR